MAIIVICQECGMIVGIGSDSKNIGQTRQSPKKTYKELGETIEKEIIIPKCYDCNRDIVENKTGCKYILPSNYCKRYCLFCDVCHGIYNKESLSILIRD